MAPTDQDVSTTPPATRLPAELLSEIFTHLRIAESLELMPDGVTMTWAPAVTRVCRFWRSVALETPLLWNLLDLAQPQLALGLSRRFSFPLRIRWAAGEGDIEDAWDTFLLILREAAHRVAELTVLGARMPSAGRDIADAMGGCAPSLRILILRPFSSDDGAWAPLYALKTPLLTHLELCHPGGPNHWHAPLMRSSSLRMLRLQSLRSVGMSVVLQTFRHLPCLEELEWHLGLPRDDIAAASTARVEMARLLSVTLAGVTSGCATVLRHLIIPEEAVVTAICKGDEDEPSCSRFSTSLWDASIQDRFGGPVDRGGGPDDLRISQSDTVLVVLLGTLRKQQARRTHTAFMIFKAGPAEQLPILRALQRRFALPSIVSLSVVASAAGAVGVDEWAEVLTRCPQIVSLSLANPFSARMIFDALNSRASGADPASAPLRNLKQIVVNDASDVRDDWFNPCRTFVSNRCAAVKAMAGPRSLDSLYLQQCKSITRNELRSLEMLVPVKLVGAFEFR